jgi:acyl carrier protein
MATIDEVKTILRETLQLGDRVNDFDTATPLLGSVPELDSMAVVMVITALEESFDFFVDDDEISAAMFETVGSLSEFVENKLAA